MKLDRPLKVLLFGDYSNYSPTLAQGLRNLGCDVVVASEGCFFMQTQRDINLRRRFKGKLGGLDLYWRVTHSLANKLSGYDVLGLNSPMALSLKPTRVKHVFDMLRQNNKSIFLMGTGNDPFVIEEFINSDSPLKYNEWRNADNSPTPYRLAFPDYQGWLAPELRELTDYIYNRVDGMTTALYEYSVAATGHLPAEKLAYAGIPIDISETIPVNLDSSEKIKIFLGRHSTRLLEKGTDILQTAGQIVAAKYPDKCEFVIVEDRPYNEYIELLNSAHVVLDQVYSYTPATNALLAMARGQVAFTGAEEDYFKFIKEDSMRPMINALPNVDYLVSELEKLILDRVRIKELGCIARDFVLKHNEVNVVAERVLNHWRNCITSPF